MDLSRPLTAAEHALAAGMFGTAIDYARVTIHRRRWWPFQPRDVTMAPDGNLWFHPAAPHYRDCFGAAPLSAQGHFIHEMTHVWHAQRRGKWWLPLMRHPFCRYDYEIIPDKPFARYGIEQQAEILHHAFLLRRGIAIESKPGSEVYEEIIPFRMS